MYDQPPKNCYPTTYNEIRCFIGLLLWTGLAQFPNRRAYYTESKVYYLPHFISHMSRNRFDQLFTVLHFANNEQLPANLPIAKRFEAKLGNLLTAMNTNSSRLMTPAQSLSIDEMLIPSYHRTRIRQYMKAKPHKYGFKLWAICCACCGYSLKQDLYLGSSVESTGGRDVVLQLSQPYLSRGHVVFADRFFLILISLLTCEVARQGWLVQRP